MKKDAFHIVLVAPSKYGVDGYPMRWKKDAMPPFTLSVLNGIAEDCRKRNVLGNDVDITVEIIDDNIDDIPFADVSHRIHDAGSGMVGIVGVMTAMYPRALDIAKNFRLLDVNVVIGGYHVSGNIAMFEHLSPELQDAVNHGVILYAGPAEPHFDELMRDVYSGCAQPVYNKIGSPLNLKDAPLPLVPVNRVNNSFFGAAGIDTSRGCPFKCSFCCIPDVFGHNIESRSPDSIVEFITHYNKLGVTEFFFTDDNFCRNRQWEVIFDKLADARRTHNLNYSLTIEVDTLAYKIPNFLEKGRRAGVNDVFIGLETIDPETAKAANKKHNCAADYRTMFKKWFDAGYTTIAGIIIGFPNDTREKVLHSIDILINDIKADFVSPFILTPIPGSRDHKNLIEQGVVLDPNLSKYDVAHLVFPHATMSAKQLESLQHETVKRYYSLKNCWNICRRNYERPGRPGDGGVWLMAFVLGRRASKLSTFDLGLGRKFKLSERDSNFPRESPVIFYPRYWAKNVYISARVLFFYIVIKVMQKLARYQYLRRQRLSAF